MRLEWLEDILAIAETGSLTEAAEKRNLTQSAFSRRIQTIEDRIGVQLLDRSHKPIQLKPAALDRQEQMGKLAEELRILAADLRRGERAEGNRVVIASQHALTTSLMPSLLGWLDTREPEAFVRLRSANMSECTGLLLSREADFSVTYHRPGEAYSFEADYVDIHVLRKETFIPVVAANKTEAMDVEFQAGTLPIINYPTDVFLGELMETTILPELRRIARPVAKTETALTLAALEFAASGIGVAWVPSSLAQAQLDSGRLVDLSTSLPSIGLEVTCLRLTGPLSPTAERIWTHFKEQS